jgi:hypothetical protein
VSEGIGPGAAIIAAVDPQALIVVGFVALAAGVLVLLSFGPRFRVGRLLAATPATSVAAAIAGAKAGRRDYVRVRGRIDSDGEFEDAAHRPLVLRRTRVQVRRGGRWRTVDEGREIVPFGVTEGLDAIGVDAAALDVGLVVVPREATGRVADIADRVPPDVRADTPARVVVEQVSSVEHAIVLGVPVEAPGGTIALTAGGGRPLVLTTLEVDDAMRILTGGDRRRAWLAATLLGAGLLLVAGGLALGLGQALFAPTVALAAEPSMTPATGGDPRSEGEGPGFVGQPLLAIGLVVVIGVIALLATLAFVRLTRDRRPGGATGHRP